MGYLYARLGQEESGGRNTLVGVTGERPGAGAGGRAGVRSWTTAPASYDGFGTRTLSQAGALREVEVDPEHIAWQQGRYQSGGYLARGEVLDQGGLFRCCVQAWEDRPPDVAIVRCGYCGEIVSRCEAGVWSWERATAERDRNG